MILRLHTPAEVISGNVVLPGSKSISNRILIIKALSGLSFSVKNISDADDTKYLSKALDNYSTNKVIDVGHAGTDLRFLTAFLSIKNDNYELTGSERLKQRPIKELVDVLRKLGAEIDYKNVEGFPPLIINGKQLNGGKVEISGSVSSQFITALLLVAPYFKNGLELTILNELVSKPYVNMTIELMKAFGASVSWKDKIISVSPIPYLYTKDEYIIESDWSAASYFYSLVALSPLNTTLELEGLFKYSLQADSICETLYKSFGVTTEFLSNKIVLTKSYKLDTNFFEYDFITCPDISQTTVCTCIGLKLSFKFTGLQTLKVKETDRIIALKNEIKKFGFDLSISENSIQSVNNNSSYTSHDILITTYNDHRMAMSFAPLCLLYDGISIEHAEVVSKSYPLFWKHLQQIGIKTMQL
jgi:3-phosphoshikimate 1-carboxyvinyltransferase